MEMLKDYLTRSAKSAGLSGHWINSAAQLLHQLAEKPEDLQKHIKFKCVASSSESFSFSVSKGLVFTKAPFGEVDANSIKDPKLIIWEGTFNSNEFYRRESGFEAKSKLLLVEQSIPMNYGTYMLLQVMGITAFQDMRHRLYRFSSALSSCTSCSWEVVTLHDDSKKPLVCFGNNQTLTVLLKGPCTYDLKVMKTILQSAFNLLRNRLLPASSYLVVTPPLEFQQLKTSDRVEESFLKEEISRILAFEFQQPENESPSSAVYCQYRDEFRSLRSRCKLLEAQYLTSLSSCKAWEAKGGKSQALFMKTNDNRFIIKEISKDEYDSFTIFGPNYFSYLREAIESNSKTCLAKIFGMYELTSDHRRFIVVENLSSNRHISMQYDLKGSLPGRLAPESSEVYLDQNFVINQKMSPLQIISDAKLKLEIAIRNDTLFLSSQGVMDYSCLLGIDTENHVLVCGIIDYLAPYNWKKLESAAKSVRNRIIGETMPPTVIHPIDYMDKFVDFMLGKVLFAEESRNT